MVASEDLRLDFLYKLRLDSLPLGAVVSRNVPYYLIPPLHIFLSVRKSAIQVLSDVVARALSHHFSLINAHL